jgi:L-aspartate oxidase
VELRRHRAHHQAPGARPAPHSLLKEEIDEYYQNFRVTHDLLELRNLVEVANLIVNSALLRRESRGLHFSRDYPETLAKALPTILTPPRRK